MVEREGDLHVVLGASGGTGAALVAELLGRGRRVRAVSRGGGAAKGVEWIGADVSSPEGALRAVRGASVVYHAAQPPYTRWPEEFPAMTEAIVGGAAAAGARLVFADNLYMYGPGSPQPLVEGAPERATGRKGAVRARMASDLLAAHREGRVPVAIGRSSDYYGPGGVGTVAGETVFGAALAGRTVRWPGSLDAPHGLNYLPDMARALVTLGEREEAYGEVWHLPAAEPLTARGLVARISAELGRRVRVSATPKVVLRALGLFSPLMREFAETSYQFEGPFYADATKYERAFGPFRPTPHDRALGQTLAWFRARKGS